MHMCLTGQTVVKPRHLFVHKIPELDVVGDTLSTLKFAEWVAIVELGAAQANKESSNVSNLKEQKEGEQESVMFEGNQQQKQATLRI
ncbi:kinesin-like protein KIN-14Q isoform X2 [Bidens hawaiensis]|uniref:kinesin-like protein KIN-14Q isoform X2 n=1 Tax=Bidens hawaiensis TaxID=980011 RepID=UPI004049759B